MNTSEVLTRAADLIEQRGHTKRRHVTVTGCLCVAGAMFAAVGMEPDHKHFDSEFWPGYTPDRADLVKVAYDWFRDWLDRMGVDCRDPVDWNDAKKRTKEEVVTTLRGAAEAARAEQ